MRIVVAGLAATYPLGGVFWDYLQYTQGFVDLGHEVLYLEDTGAWFYDPASATRIESGAVGAEWLQREIGHNLPDLNNSWFVRDISGASFGVAEGLARQFCLDAELLLNISGSTMLNPDQLPRARSVYVDSDPVYSQALVPRARAGLLDPDEQWRMNRMLAYDKTFSFGENIGQRDCLVPADFFDWSPTRQPIATETIARYRVPSAHRKRKLTTIGSWEPYAEPLVVAGRAYGGKQSEFLRFRDLPLRSAVPLELALAGTSPIPEMTSRGWKFVDPGLVSASADGYLAYLGSSYAEWSVAKHAYVASKSGWFSGRTALYLTLGVPAIVQDTGFSRFLPTGSGLFAFSTLDEAVDATHQVTADYAHHCAAAEEIAHEYFDARRVLSRLLDDAFSSDQPISRNT